VSLLPVFGADAGDFRSGRLNWDVLNSAAAHERVLPGLIDLSARRFLRPYSIACLCAIGARTEKRCKLVPPKDAKCNEHLARLGVYDWFTLQGSTPSVDERETNIVVEHLEDRPGSSADTVIDLLLRDQTISAGEAPILKTHLDEMIRNALCHSESKVGCFVAGQLFPKTGRLELAIVDLGCTIPGHLCKNPKYAAIKPRDAIVVATQNGVTGTVGLNRWKEPNSGAGLHSLRSFCESGRGELSIVSGPCIAVFHPNEVPLAKPFRGGFAGCLVNIRFFLNLGLRPAVESDRAIW